jgi:hypothetical protein
MPNAPSKEDSLDGIHLLSLALKTIRVRVSLFVLLVLASGSCDRTGPLDPAVGAPGGEDSTTPPPATPDTTTGDTTDSSGTDSTVPPPVSPPSPPPAPVSHEGLPFGPAQLPPAHFPDFSGTVYPASKPDKLIRDLEAARRAGARLFISFTGNEQFNRDSNGFSLAKWEQRVDRFRGVDLTPYIAEGTIVGHLLLDEPQDPTNWNGKRVSQAQIEEIAKYSKQVWPTMPTVIRAQPTYLQGYQYPHLDAIRLHYVARLGPIEDWVSVQVQGAQALGLGLIGGLNVLNGGSEDSGIPGKAAGKYAMSADQIRSWGGRFLSEPYICGFLMYQYDSTYLSRPDIQAALSDLGEMARSLPKRSCRP